MSGDLFDQETLGPFLFDQERILYTLSLPAITQTESEISLHSQAERSWQRLKIGLYLGSGLEGVGAILGIVEKSLSSTVFLASVAALTSTNTYFITNKRKNEHKQQVVALEEKLGEQVVVYANTALRVDPNSG